MIPHFRHGCSASISSDLLSRRHFCRKSLTIAAALTVPSVVRGKELKAQIEDIQIIFDEGYSGWPTLARRANGELWVAFSGGRVDHLCPFGKLMAIRSRDDGKTWTTPRVLLDSILDDRDGGILETAKGTLLATTFTSTAAEDLFKKAESGELNWSEEKLAQWRAQLAWADPETRKDDPGEWLVRSTDGGHSWSGRISTLVNSPHGPIQLSDGRLLYAGKQLWTLQKKLGVAESNDDGLSWKLIAEIPIPEGMDERKDLHELHAVEAADNTIIVHIRCHKKPGPRKTLQTESRDGGKTWSTPHSIGVQGFPSHLTRLRDDRLLMTYGYRRPPFGNRARISEDNGKTWSDPLIISDDGAGMDLGYPSTVELPDGLLLTVWYENMGKGKNTVLRMARWRLK